MRQTFSRGGIALTVAIAIASVTAGIALAGGGSSSSKPAGLEFFISGPLADLDARAMQGKSATASVFAYDRADGVATIEVEVDGRRVALDRNRCRGSCPETDRFEFDYVAKRYGNSRHEIDFTVTGGGGHSIKRTIVIERDPTGKTAGAPSPVPAFYVTAPNTNDLDKQVAKAAKRVAGKQDNGHTLLVLDFGAARLKGDTYGSSLRSGTFFSSDKIKSALQAAADAYEKSYRRGEVTIVYANSNGHISSPGSGYTAFDESTAHKAGETQGKVIGQLDLGKHTSAAVGGDIEPGYDKQPELSTAMVAGAIEGAGGKPYFNFGTAPCSGKKCVNGWSVKHICATSAGKGRHAMPEIYNVTPVDQSAVWARIKDDCKITSFPGASANLLGDLQPREAWVRLRQKTGVDVGEALVVWPK